VEEKYHEFNQYYRHSIAQNLDTIKFYIVIEK